jgi:hypothetical protein
MLTPAKRHFQKVQAEQESKKASESGLRPDLNQYELMQAQLHEHTLQLKQIQSIETKAKKKAELLPVYGPYIEGVLKADSGIQDDVLMQIMIWCIDAGAYADALEIAQYAVKHGLTPPDKFQRDTVTIIAEDIAEAALKNAFPLPLLEQTAELVMDKDMPDQVKGKLHKALGMHAELQKSEPQTALNHLQSADGLLNKSGVKTAIKKLQKRIEEAEAAAAAEGDNDQEEQQPAE